MTVVDFSHRDKDGAQKFFPDGELLKVTRTEILIEQTEVRITLGTLFTRSGLANPQTTELAENLGSGMSSRNSNIDRLITR